MYFLNIRTLSFSFCSGMLWVYRLVVFVVCRPQDPFINLCSLFLAEASWPAVSVDGKFVPLVEGFDWKFFLNENHNLKPPAKINLLQINYLKSFW